MPDAGLLSRGLAFFLHGVLIHSVKGEHCDCLEMSDINRVTGFNLCRGPRHDSNSVLGWLVD